jgi:uncharacterized delta-60 repeat protein
MRKLSLLLLFSTALFSAIGQPGSLDSSFGNNGIQTTAFSGQTSFSSTALQGDKVVTAGSVYDPVTNSSDFALARYKSNGSLDSSFGVNGKVTTDFENSDQVIAIAIQGDKIIMAGYGFTSTVDYVLVRYTTNGTLDSSFGVNGKVTTDININSIAIQGDKIIVGGGTFAQGFLVRYTADGALDSSFGVNGIAAVYFNPSAIAFQGDKIVVGGSIYNSGDYDFALARYTADGKLDSSFGTNGNVTTDFGNPDDLANAIALQGDKIILAGFTSVLASHENDFALARYTADGSLDSSFGVNGKVVTREGSSVTSLVLQGDKIIAAGYTYDFSTSISAAVLILYTANGALDRSFGVNGKAYLGSNSAFKASALHENRLYAVGSLDSGTGKSYGLVAAYKLEATGPTICISDVTVCESQKHAVVTIHLSASSTQVVQVHYKSHHGTAYAGQDYLSVEWTLQFAPGVTTAKVKIPILDDSICESTEQFEVHLSSPQHATIKDSIGVVTIIDDDKTVTLNEDNALAAKQSTSLSIIAGPNPSADAFDIQLHSSDLKQLVSIRIYDVNGRLLEVREHLSIGQRLHLGDQYKAGAYIIEAVQGSQRVQTKVIKTGK